MFAYIKGIITDIEPSYVVIENNGIGYMIYVSDPYSYSLGKEILIYLYQQIREDENTLYGFKSKEEKELFLKLISVKGLGCKMALPMLVGNSKDSIYEAIENGNINYLKKFPKIGDKVARQIILDLKGNLASNTISNEKNYTELFETLKSLGYKATDIKKILPQIDISKTLDLQLKDALKLLLK